MSAIPRDRTSEGSPAQAPAGFAGDEVIMRGMKIRQLRIPAALALFGAACLDTALPNTAQRQAHLRVAADVIGAVAASEVEVTVSYLKAAGGHVPITAQRFPLEPHRQQQFSIPVDVTACLVDPEHAPSTSGCPLLVAATLRDSTGLAVDSQAVGPVSLAPGQTATAPGLTLREIAGITVRLDRDTLYAPDTAAATATLKDNAGAPITGRTVQWTSSNTAVATVSPDGRVVAIAPGGTTITATSQNRQGSATVTVRQFQAVIRWADSQPLDPGPTPENIGGIWGTSPSNVFAMGFSTLYRYDGTAWRVVKSTNQCCYQALAGLGPTDLVAVGSGGKIIRSDGTTITQQTSGTTRDLFAVASIGPGTAFTVGDAGTVLRLDGTSWTPVAAPTTNPLRAVCGTSPADVFAGGDGGTMLHFDGTRWTALPLPSTEDVTGLWCGSSTVYVVTATRDRDGGTYITGHSYRLDGTSWTLLAMPTGTQQLRAISGTGPTDLYAAGNGPAAYHFDGSTWVRLADLPWDYGSIYTLLSVWADGRGIFAGSTEGTTLAYRDGVWTPLGISRGYRGIYAASPSAIYAVGVFGEIARFDGRAWTAMTSGTTHTLRGVWGTGPNNVYAVGPFVTMLHFDGVSWRPVPLPTANGLWGIWGSGPNDVYAVGDAGTIVHFDGISWTQQSSGVNSGFGAVWGSSATDVFAVANDGTILHSDGRTWRRMASGSSESLQSVWGSGPTDVYASGSNATILHYDGASWRGVQSGGPATVYGLWGTGPNDVYAVGCGGGGIGILHFDGHTWSQMGTECAFGIDGFRSGGAIVGDAFRRITTGLGPRGNLGVRIPSESAHLRP